MQFLKVEGWQPAIDALSSELSRQLEQKQRVLWFVCGGSNVQASVQVRQRLPAELTKYLAVLLIDERFGPPGHKDSNYQQLLDAGFQPGQSTFPPVLVAGYSLAETTERYNELVARALAQATVTIAQLGIGSDGHIAGILPHSPAAHATGLVTSYSAAPYQRITATFDALRRIDIDYSFVFGQDKQPALQRLQNEQLELAERPSQILKELKEVYIYNDQVGEEGP